MNDEISWLCDQLRRSFLFSNGLRLELTNGGVRQRLLEIVVKESENEVTGLVRGQRIDFPPPLGQDNRVICESDVFGASYRRW